MKRKKIAIVILLLAGLTLLVTQERWLSYTLNKLAVLGDYSAILEGLDALVNLILIMFNASMAYLLWLSKNHGGVEKHKDKDPKIIDITPEFYHIPTDKLLRSSIPNLSSIDKSDSEWILTRLQEAYAGLDWIDRDCGFSSENYIGLNLIVKETRLSSSYTILRVNPIESALGLDTVKHRSKNANLQEYRSNNIFEIYTKYTVTEIS